MSEGVEAGHPPNWIASRGFVKIFQTFRLAIHPTKLALALIALVATWGWGSILDVIWTAADRGVSPNAIAEYVAGGEAAAAFPTPDQVGIFAVWTKHSAWCIESAFASIRHGAVWGVPIAPGFWLADAVVGEDSSGLRPPQPAGLIPCAGLMCKGTTWLVREHGFFALVFAIVALAIWALLGGAICRIAAVQFAREEKIGVREALRFASERFWAGFFLSPVLPVVMLLLIGVILAVGGVFLRIPYLGDVLGSVVFFLALLGGFAAALIVIGTVGGGSLFWPTVAAEGSESLDAVSRSFNYVAATPWRTLFYGLVAAVYASLCFLFVRLVIGLTLIATHLAVGFGTSPFGWWRLGDGRMSKLDLLWTQPSLAQLHPPTALPGGIESFSSVVIGFWVTVVVLLAWAFLASFYLSGSTVIYFLLRRLNDGMDLEDVYIDTYQEGEFGPSAEAPQPEPVVQIGTGELSSGGTGGGGDAPGATGG